MADAGPSDKILPGATGEGPTALAATGCVRRRLLALAIAAWALPIGTAGAETALRRPASLPAEAAAASRRGQPLVLLINLPGCPYCESVRSAYLLPLAREQNGIVQIDLTSAEPVLDFGGVTSTHHRVATRLAARLAPTLVFFDSAGSELAERLVGVGSVDFYGALLEQRLETARARLKRR
jgi:thioredoxin-related protein